MNDQRTNEEIFLRYLLGQLSEAERAQVEERFLREEDYYQQLLLVEDELRCAYAQGSLSAAEREQFEKRFLIFPDEREKASLAKAMISELATMNSSPARAEERSRGEGWRAFFGFRSFAVGFAVATAVVLVALGWMAYETARLRQQVAQLESRETTREQESEQQAAAARARVDQLNRELEVERQTRARLEQELAAAREQPPASMRTAILSLLLLPGQMRGGGETRRLTIPPNAAQVQLRLRLGEKNSYRSYQAVLLNSDGAQVWSRTGLRAQPARGTPVVVLQIPARRLAEDDYEINLKGITASGDAERVGDYYFTVLKK